MHNKSTYHRNQQKHAIMCVSKIEIKCIIALDLMRCQKNNYESKKQIDSNKSYDIIYDGDILAINNSMEIRNILTCDENYN